ncbi:Flp pilus assembly protein TadG [Friedmanniella endophytica]|uniref:Flp pilus assembly protein TadG n=1 Tax=Microlunatus kandeliicorticis TaxID=1759536 RepID=A0A7W3IQX7_9ACTN|nr:Flp pilus assembly protein TadG [Microlunatus kandeliicorticis]
MVIMVALILTAGLVIDGGQQVDAASRAQSIAAAAARAGSEAQATDALAGSNDTGRALAAAQAYLDGSGVPGTVGFDGDRLRVTTEITVPTLMLSVIGIDSVRGRGEAEAELVGSR